MALKTSILQASQRPRPGTTGQPPAAAAPTAPAAVPRRDPRAHAKSIGFWTSRDAHRALHLLAVNCDTTAERLMNEALNLLFRHYDKPTIAPVGDPSDAG